VQEVSLNILMQPDLNEVPSQKTELS